MSKYIKVYETLCPNDPVDKDDPRRASIIAEMRAIHRANTVEDAAAVIDWWSFNNDGGPNMALAFARKARKLLGVKQ